MKYLILTALLFSGILNSGWCQSIIDTVFFENGGIDSYTSSASATTNFGSDTCLRAYYDYGSPTVNNYSYLKADFSGIPSSAIVTDAVINLYAISVNNGADHTMALQRLTASWTETGITWTNYPNATGVNAVTMSNAATSELGWQAYTMTDIVRFQVSNPAQNYGCRILLNAQSGTVDKGVIYASTEHANSGIRPYVIVEYYVPTNDTIYFESSKDARVYSGSTGTNYGADSLLSVSWDYGTSGTANRTFLYADLSHIPRNSLIATADIYLNALSVDNTGSHPMQVEGVNSTSWAEGSINWANQPTVWSSYRSGITHSATSATGWQKMSIINLAKYAVWLPEKNYGWRIALQSESDTLDKGVVYASSEHDSVELRPYMVIEYLPPIEIEGFVTHCSPGNNDGSIVVSSITGGCNLYTSYNWRKLSGGGLTSVETGTNMALKDVSGLSDGLYLLEIVDYRGLSGYKYFFVGEEGTTTNVEFGYVGAVDRVKYTEDSWVTWTKSTGDSSNVGGSATTVGCYTNTSYDGRTFIQYKVDWDPYLEFTNAKHCVTNKGGCTQGVNSDNDAWISRVTEPWGEMYVTWGTKPDITTENRFYIATTTTNGNEARSDTFDILAFIPYWQEFPEENFGFELALNDYTQAAAASRDYNSSDQTGHNLLISYTVFSSNTKYWVGNESSDWNNPLNWSDVSGGIGGAGVPDIKSIVVFDGNGNTNCYSSTNKQVETVVILPGYTANIDFNGSELISNQTFTQNE